MKLGLLLRYSGQAGGPDIEPVLEAERLGYDSVWSGEAYGTDAVTPTSWILAQTTKIKAGTSIMQMPARTPACTAMTAMTLQAMSNGRFLLGLGPSGPQVVEGWHGLAYGKPLTRTREYVEIVRKAFAREAPLTHAGSHYTIPYNGADATGLGKPLKTILHPDPNLKIYTASIAPAGLRCAGEVADGVQPIFMNPADPQLISTHVAEGMAKADNGKSMDDFDIAPFVRVAMDDDLQAARDRLKPELALYIGGMGAREKNFYNDYAKRLGFADAAVKIQDAFLDGRRGEAIGNVPDSMVDAMCLVGPADHMRGQLEIWQDAGKSGQVGTMLLGGASIEAIRLVAETVL